MGRKRVSGKERLEYLERVKELKEQEMELFRVKHFMERFLKYSHLLYLSCNSWLFPADVLMDPKLLHRRVELLLLIRKSTECFMLNIDKVNKLITRIHEITRQYKHTKDQMELISALFERIVPHITSFGEDTAEIALLIKPVIDECGEDMMKYLPALTEENAEEGTVTVMLYHKVKELIDGAEKNLELMRELNLKNVTPEDDVNAIKVMEEALEAAETEATNANVPADIPSFQEEIRTSEPEI